MSKELDEKWRELVEAGRAEWAPGMRDRVGGWRWSVSSFIMQGLRIPGVGNCIEGVPDPVPDWTDPATLGALLGQVRKRWNDPAAHLVPDGDWHVRGDLPWTQYGTGDTEAEALLAALEAAP